MGSIWLWVGFNVFVLALLALDLGVFHRKAHAISVREATIWSVIWISLSMLFNLGIYFFWHDVCPNQPALERRCSAGVLHRLPDRKIPQRRQYFCVCADLQLFQCAGEVSAPRAVLGHFGRAGDARGADPGRRGADQRIPLGHLDLRRVLDLYRDQNGLSQG